MNTKHSFAVLSLSFCLSAFAADGDDALFGLRWGMTIPDVKAVSVNLTKKKGERNLEFYSSTSLPKNISDVELYSMIFADGKLVKIWAISKDISNDPTGSTGKERFETLQSTLAEKYGKTIFNSQSIGNKLYKEYDEFYQCLAYSGCGQWTKFFESADKVISVELKGLRRGIGYIEVTAEAKPQWNRALEAYKSNKSKSDKDAL